MSDPHSSSADLAYLGVAEIVARFNDGTLSSLSLIDALLERIEAVDLPTSSVALRSIAATAPDARSVAEERDEQRRSGHRVGALHGVPVLIKDNIEASGLPGAAGSTALLGRPAVDATLVTRLRNAGAIVLGSTNLSQWANIRSPRSTSGWSATGGLVANPWALDRTAGGSSSGSAAALAAGLSPLTVGTETDGSIVCPASVNGVVGLKPTVGTVPTSGVVPISASQDSPGPMARSVDDLAILFEVLSETTSTPTGVPLRIAFAANWTTGHRATDELVRQQVEAIRSHVDVIDREVATPRTGEYSDELTVLLCELHDDLSNYLASRAGAGVRSLADVVAYENAHRDVEMPYFEHEYFERALSTGGRSSSSYREARERNLAWAIEGCLTPALEHVDVLISASYCPAWKSDLIIGGSPDKIASDAGPAPSIAGWPILSIPIGLVHGLPVGLSVIARASDEARLIEAARVIELIVAPSMSITRASWLSATKG